MEVTQVREFLWRFSYRCISIFYFHWEASTPFAIVVLNYIQFHIYLSHLKILIRSSWLDVVPKMPFLRRWCHIKRESGNQLGIQYCSLLTGVWKTVDQICSLFLHLLSRETNSMSTALRQEFAYNVNTDDCHWGNIFHSNWWRVSLALSVQMHSARKKSKLPNQIMRNTLIHL